MLHFKLISAQNLPQLCIKRRLAPYAKVATDNFGFHSNGFISHTKKINNTTNPQWNDDIYIPFYTCQSIYVEIWDGSSTHHQTLIGWTHIHFNGSNLYLPNTDIKTVPITLKDSSKKLCDPFLSYILELCQNFPMRIKSKKHPHSIFCYYTTSLKPSISKQFELCCSLINKNGTCFPALEDFHVFGENDPNHYGPTGLSQVFQIQTSHFIDSQFFFYIKSSQYSGEVTLHFAFGPEDYTSKTPLKHFGIFHHCVSIKTNVENEHQHAFKYVVFPIVLHCKENSVSFIETEIPDSVMEPLTSELDSNKVIDSEKQICERIGQIITPKTKKFHMRHEIFPGEKCSIEQAFKQQNIQYHPKSITLSFDWNTDTHMEPSLLPICEINNDCQPVCYYHPTIQNGSIKTSGFAPDETHLRVKLWDLPDKLRYIGIALNSTKGIPFNDIDGAYLRIFDDNTGKEIMFLNVENKTNKTGVIIGVLAKVDGHWEVWSCMKYFHGKHPSESMSYFKDNIKSFAQKFVNQSE